MCCPSDLGARRQLVQWVYLTKPLAGTTYLILRPLTPWQQRLEFDWLLAEELPMVFMQLGQVLKVI